MNCNYLKVSDIRFDVEKAYNDICLKIGQHLVDNGEQDPHLKRIAELLYESIDEMNKIDG